MSDEKDGRSEEKVDWLGNKYTQHYDKDGNKAGWSDEKEGFFGGNYTQHHSQDGDKSGWSEHKEGWLGNNYDQHYDQSGEKGGWSEHKEGWLGAKYVQEYDEKSQKTGWSEKKEGWLGGRYKQHYGDAEWRTAGKHEWSGIDGTRVRVSHDGGGGAVTGGARHSTGSASGANAESSGIGTIIGAITVAVMVIALLTNSTSKGGSYSYRVEDSPAQRPILAFTPHTPSKIAPQPPTEGANPAESQPVELHGEPAAEPAGSGDPDVAPRVAASPEPAQPVEPTLVTAPSPSRETVEDAQRLFLANRYEDAIASASRQLESTSDPALKLLIGYSHLQLGRGRDAAMFLSEAIDRGVIAQLPIQHHHKNMRVHILSQGVLKVSRAGLHYRPLNRVFIQDGFSVLWEDIVRNELSPFDKSKPEITAIRLDVRLQPRKKDTRTFNFFPPAARTNDGNLTCTTRCPSDAAAINDLITQYRSAPLMTGPSAPEVGGLYSGQAVDSTGPGKMSWQLTQEGDRVSGTVTATTPRNDVAFKGDVSGTLNGSTFSFTLMIPNGGVSEKPDCRIVLEGTASVVGSVLKGIYTGQSTCTKPIKDGRFSLLLE